MSSIASWKAAPRDERLLLLKALVSKLQRFITDAPPGVDGPPGPSGPHGGPDASINPYFNRIAALKQCV